MDTALLQSITTNLPDSGAWAVAVSGGADSVALLMLLRQLRPTVRLHVVHLNHQTRGDASDADATFVQTLAASHHLQATIATIDEILPTLKSPPTNRSALFRMARFALFQRVVQDEKLDGVILAHHRLDQAETVLLRLMRGSGVAGLGGMDFIGHHAGMIVRRPLLDVCPQHLRAWLNDIGQPWREDASNDSATYQRNRVRGWLRSDDSLVNELIALSPISRSITEWTASVAPILPRQFQANELDGFPPIAIEHACRRWLKQAGVPTDDISSQVVARLLRLTNDAASPAVVDFPGNVRIRRKKGKIGVDLMGESVR